MQPEVEIAGPGTFAVEVVGVSRYQDVLESAGARGAMLVAKLVLEDENPHDRHAVAVYVEGERAGYLSRTNARLYRADLAAAGQADIIVVCKAKIVGGFEIARGERAHFGLKLDLPRLSA
jgi:hypothetical protein